MSSPKTEQKKEDFYTNLQVGFFQERGTRITFSNPDCTAKYEAILKERGLKYKVVNGLGHYGKNTFICTPEDFEKTKRQLLHLINFDKNVLERRRVALKELEDAENENE